MSRGQLRTLVRHLRRLTGRPDASVPDAELLHRFVAAGDEAAFELLLWRHGPMVRGVCQRMLRHTQDAEDAFQATFLTLLRKAGSISHCESLAGWLYRVAYRVALRAQDVAARQPKRLPPHSDAPAPEPISDLIWRDLRPVLDEEINQLPRKYRLPIILCYFEGKTHEQAARELGCPKGTIDVRLMRAREQLRGRLARRGLALSAGLLATALTQQTAAALPVAVSDTVLNAVLAYAAGNGAAGAVSAPVAALTEGVLQSMMIAKLKTTVASVLLALCLLGVGSAAVLSTRAGSAEATDQPAVGDEEPVIVNVPSERAGKLLFIATETKPGEAVPPDRAVVATVAFLALEILPLEETKEPTFTIDGKTYRRWKPEDLLAPGRLRVVREKRVFRQLRAGDEVQEGQRLALVNPAVVIDELAAKLAKLDMAEAEVRISEKTKLVAENRYHSATQAYRGKAISEEDWQAAKLAWDRYIEEERARRSAVLQAQAEVQTALTILSMYEIRSPARGVIRKILQHPGEAVQELETVFQIQIAGKSEDKPARWPLHAHVPCERDGRLICLATDIKPGEGVPDNQRAKGIAFAFLVLALDKDEKWTGPTYTIDGKLYRSWKEGEELVPDKVRVYREKRDLRNLQVGDHVEPGQLLALVNPSLAIDELNSKVAKLHAAEAEVRVAEKTKLEAEKRYASATQAYRGRAISEDDWRAAKLTWDRYMEEEYVKRAAVRQAQAEVQAALTMLQMYEIRSNVRGTIRGFAKKAGEGVKSLETVLTIEIAGKSRE